MMQEVHAYGYHACLWMNASAKAQYLYAGQLPLNVPLPVGTKLACL